MTARKSFAIVSLLLLAKGVFSNEIVHYCDDTNSNNSFIFCYGRLLKAVQLARLFPDAKEFVDMPLKVDANSTLAEFNQQFPPNEPHIDREKLQTFVDEHFAAAGSDLIQCDSTDWRPSVDTLSKINDGGYREWAQFLHKTWLELCKKVNASVLETPERHTLLYVPHPFIVPGGRFREFYYWDNFFTIKGLLVSEMYTTVRLQLLDMIYLVDKHGLVPNGGREYYLKRSQPPLLIQMVNEYYQATHNVTFLKTVLPSLETEFRFWETNRKTAVALPDGGSVDAFRFRPLTNQPRPESYLQDYLLANSSFTSEEDKRRFYRNIAAAAESGRDFSSRWFRPNEKLASIETEVIVPVDLNAILCGNSRLMADFYRTIGEEASAQRWQNKWTDMRSVIRRLFWNETAGVWFDFHTTLKRQRTDFYPAVVTPLLMDCQHDDSATAVKRVLHYLRNMTVLDYPGGIPSSLFETGEQWDFPNGWTPENYWIIDSFSKPNMSSEFQEVAFDQANKLLQLAYRTWRKTGFMWEKYNVTGSIPQPGSGGEYDVQKGFGWTNGVVLDLLNRFNDRLESPPYDNAATSIKYSAVVLFSVLAFHVTVLHSNHNSLHHLLL